MPRPADVADRLTKRISHFQVLQFRRQTDFLQGPIATIPHMQVRQAVWQVSRPRNQREQAAGTQMSQRRRRDPFRQRYIVRRP